MGGISIVVIYDNVLVFAFFQNYNRLIFIFYFSLCVVILPNMIIGKKGLYSSHRVNTPSPDKHAEVNNHSEVTSRTSTQGVKFFFDFSKIVGFNSFVVEFRLS